MVSKCRKPGPENIDGQSENFLRSSRTTSTVGLPSASVSKSKRTWVPDDKPTLCKGPFFILLAISLVEYLAPVDALYLVLNRTDTEILQSVLP